MSILIDQETKVICQGITGQAGSFHAKACLDYGARIVAGVTPGKGGTQVEGIPVYDTVREAVKTWSADATMIFVPAPYAADAVLEAVEAGLRVIICITEGIPIMDMMKVRACLQARQKEREIYLIGPNGPGVITPEACKIGIMPGYIHKRGRVGVVSRSGTLTYEAVWQLTQKGIGQSTVVGIGGDPVKGMDFIDVLALFEKDPQTEAVLMIGEIGGRAEEDAARFFKGQMTKPLFAFVAGRTAPPGKRMGHAGAIIEGSGGRAEDKIEALKSAGIHVIESLVDIGTVVSQYCPTVVSRAQASSFPRKRESNVSE
jgi:succinyl-CoA synthetase alpha subunit